MAKVDPKEIFWSADGFSIACGTVQTAAATGSAIIFTFVVATMEALILELYLKCLIMKGCQTWDEFKHRLDIAAPKFGETMRLAM